MLAGNTYLVRGDGSTLGALYTLLRREGIEVEGNADAYIRTYRHFGIDEARELSARAYGKSFAGSRVFVVLFSVITNEAQNALLKTLEEPPSDARFFLVTPSPTTLLPTLRSRAQMLDVGTNEESVLDVQKFLKAKARDRIDMLKPLLEKDDDDLQRADGGKAGRRDIGSIITFLSSLERALSRMQDARGGIDAIYRARMYVGDKGSLLKPLLEQVALLVPVL